MPKKFRCCAYDERGERCEDIFIDIPPPPSLMMRSRWALAYLIRRYTPFHWNLAYRIGLTDIRNITDIRISGR